MSTSIRTKGCKCNYKKEQKFFKPENKYEARQEDFSKISRSPIATSKTIKNAE